MEVIANGHVTTPQGYRAAGVIAGIKPSGKPDLALILSDRPALATGLFTTNKVHAYNVDRNRRLLDSGRPLRAIAVTAGNANVATGAQGRRDTDSIAAQVATCLALQADEVAVAQTGVIGVKLPMERISEGIPRACAALDSEGGLRAAEAICTTDTHTKQLAVRLEMDAAVHLGAIAKGAGMIHPNLATLLCFVTSDVAIEATPLQKAVRRAVEETLNTISIDGDQSTSDTLLVMANGAAGNDPIRHTGDSRWGDFTAGLTTILDAMAAAIARDGEGASKLLVVTVRNAASAEAARLAARAVAASSLVKCAVHGNDPNWGRIACAAGYSGVDLDPRQLGVSINGHTLMADGEPVGFEAAAVSASMRSERVEIEVDLAVGAATGRAYGCDLTEGYVRFNAEYTT